MVRTLLTMLALGSIACPSVEDEPAVPPAEEPDDERDDDYDCCREDPWGPVDSLTFAFSLQIGEPEDGADAVPVVAEHRVSYWADADNWIPICTQTVRLEGTLTQREGITDELGVTESCPDFSGLLELDPATYRDVYDPSRPNGACNPTDLRLRGEDHALRMLQPPDPDADPRRYGDFLRLAVLTAADQERLGATLLADGSFGVDELHQRAEESGVRYLGAGYLEPSASSLAAEAGLGEITAPPTEGCPWLAGFRLQVSGDDDAAVGFDGEGLFVLNL